MQKQRVICWVVAGVLLLGAAGWTAWKHIAQRRAAVGIAEISVDGEVQYTFDLSKRYDTPLLVSIPEDSEDNVVQVETGKISMYSATCPDHICMKTGAISKPGETIVCLPHKVVITIVEKGVENADALDAQA